VLLETLRLRRSLWVCGVVPVGGTTPQTKGQRGIDLDQ